MLHLKIVLGFNQASKVGVEASDNLNDHHGNQRHVHGNSDINLIVTGPEKDHECAQHNPHHQQGGRWKIHQTENTANNRD